MAKEWILNSDRIDSNSTLKEMLDQPQNQLENARQKT